MEVAPKDVFLKGSVRAYGDLHGRACSIRASFPFGELRIGGDFIRLKLFREELVIPREKVLRVHYYILPRPYIRIFHSDENVPAVVQFGTLRGVKLKNSLRRFGFTIEKTYWVEPRNEMDYLKRR
jgi:hypothetical protein